eukprot:scaffold161832_cov33-Prasinocladus_malaysianus.AAC.1
MTSVHHLHDLLYRWRSQLFVQVLAVYTKTIIQLLIGIAIPMSITQNSDVVSVGLPRPPRAYHHQFTTVYGWYSQRLHIFNPLFGAVAYMKI